MTSQQPETPDLRASDADREAIAERLRAAAGEGRLTLEEADERLAAAYAARTVAELAPLTADLPPTGGQGRRAAPDGGRRAAPGGGWGRPPGRAVVLALVVALWGGLLLAGLLHGGWADHEGPRGPFPFPAVPLTILVFVLLRRRLRGAGRPWRPGAPRAARGPGSPAGPADG